MEQQTTMTDGRTPVEDMSDRELLEECAHNMRACFDMFTEIQATVKQGGLMGLFKNGGKG